MSDEGSQIRKNANPETKNIVRELVGILSKYLIRSFINIFFNNNVNNYLDSQLSILF